MDKQNPRHFDMPDAVGLDLLRAIVRVGCVMGIRVANDYRVYLHPLGDDYFANVANGQYVTTLTPNERDEFLWWCRGLVGFTRENMPPPKGVAAIASKIWEKLRVDIEYVPIDGKKGKS